MKPASLVLALSIVCNIALATVYFSHRPASYSTHNISHSIQTPSVAIRPQGDFETSADNQTLVEQLRAEDFPPDVIRQIIFRRLDKEFASRRKALDPEPPFWKSNFDDYSPDPRIGRTRDPKLRAERRVLEQEFTDTIKNLLGDEAFATSAEARATNYRKYGDISDEKVANLEAINKDYDELTAQLRDTTNGVRFPEDKIQLELLEKERLADLEKTLTPDELVSYELRSSPTAKKIQEQLKYFSPNEAEYQALYAAQKIYEEQIANTSLSSEQNRLLREEIAQTVLLPQRFAEYIITTDPTYEITQFIAKRNNLSPETTNMIVGVRRDITMRADVIRRDSELTADQRNAQLIALVNEATVKLKPALDNKGMKNYLENWIKHIAPANRP